MLNQTSTTAIARTLLLAGILLAVTVLAVRSFYPAFAQATDPHETAAMLPQDFPENSDEEVVSYSAKDPEAEPVEWRIVPSTDEAASADSGSFDLTADGELSFKSPPNYEMPTDTPDQGRNTYIVQIEASDPEENTHTITVTVTVTNVDEDGTITFSATQPKEGTALTATLMDTDGEPFAADSPPTPPIAVADLSTFAGPNGTTTWQWARCDTHDDNSTCTDIPATTTATTTVTSDTREYTPSADDRGKYLRVTAMYFDGAGAEQKSAPEFPDYVVLDKEYVNTPPMFPDHDDGVAGSQITLNVMENDDAQIGYEVGAPVEADDPGPNGAQERLTYELTAGDDQGLFGMDTSSGQILLGDDDNGDPTSLDFEDTTIGDGQSYVVVITATDPSGLSTTTTATIQLTGVDEAPAIESGDEEVTYNESTDNSRNTVTVETYFADDEDFDDATLTWSLSGRDADDFSISSGGALTFASPPDFENATGGGNSNKKVYDVMVVVADDAGNEDTRDVTVTLRNVEEPGRVVLKSHPQPEAGQRIDVELVDPDGVVTSEGLEWVWLVGATTTRTENRASSTHITPPVSEIGDELRSLALTVTYVDPCDTGCVSSTASDEAIFAAAATVQPKYSDDLPPMFPNNTPVTITIEEDDDGNVGLPITATDNRDTTLLYSLSGSDRNAFNIGSTSGQITVAEGRVFNYESTKRDYNITVTARDPSATRVQHIA